MNLRALINYIISTRTHKELEEKWDMDVFSVSMFKKNFYKKRCTLKYNSLAKKARAFGYELLRDEYWGLPLDKIEAEGVESLRPFSRLEDLKMFCLKHSVEIYKLNDKFCCYIDFTEGCSPYSEEDNSFLALMKGVENYVKVNGR